MLLHLYAAQRAWLVVPDCFLASHAAKTRYGPLKFQGIADDCDLMPDEFARVMHEFDRLPFARISARAANRLLGVRVRRPTASQRPSELKESAR